MSDQAASLTAARNEATASPSNQAVQQCPLKRTAFLEIVLEDEDGEPVGEEEYLVIDQDGREHTGMLDKAGFARLEGLPPGQCQITFPMIDRREWK